MIPYRLFSGFASILILGAVSSGALADTTGAPGYAFMSAPGATSGAGSSDAMTQTIRTQIRAKYGATVQPGDLEALRAIADSKSNAGTDSANASDHAVKFSSDSFQKNPAAKEDDDARAIVAGMSPEQIRAVMEMAQALSATETPSQPAQNARHREKVVSVGDGMNSVIRDWVSGIDETGQFYIENTKIPGSRVLMKKGDIVGSLGSVADMRISGGQTQITFASGDMILGDIPTTSAVPGDDLSGEIIVSNPAPVDPTPVTAPAVAAPKTLYTEDIKKSEPEKSEEGSDPKLDHDAKAPQISTSKLAPLVSPRPSAKPSVPKAAKNGKPKSDIKSTLRTDAKKIRQRPCGEDGKPNVYGCH